MYNQIFSKMKFNLNLQKKAYYQKNLKKKNVQFVLSIFLRMKKEKLMDVPMFFDFPVLIIGVQNVVINVHFAEQNLLKFILKIKMGIVVQKMLIF